MCNHFDIKHHPLQSNSSPEGKELSVHSHMFAATCQKWMQIQRKVIVTATIKRIQIVWQNPYILKKKKKTANIK